MKNFVDLLEELMYSSVNKKEKGVVRVGIR